MRRPALFLLFLAIALPAIAEEANDPLGFDAFEQRLDAARARYATDLPLRRPEEGLRLQGLLRDALPAPVRSRILAFAETNRLVVVPSFVVSTEGRTNDVWVGVSLSVCADESHAAFGCDVVFRLHSRTAKFYPDYGEDFETYKLKHRAAFWGGEWHWNDPMIRPADWAAYPKANITWCGIDLWEIEHEDFRDGLLLRVPFDPGLLDLLRGGLDVLAEEARQISDHVPSRRGPRLLYLWPSSSDYTGLPLPASWLVPFENALGPICDETLFELTSVKRGIESEERVQPALRASVRIGETWCELTFFPFDCKPEHVGAIKSFPGTNDIPASTALWASPFLLIVPAGDSHHVFW